MDTSLNPVIINKSVSLKTIGEFLSACLKIGESNVVIALREAQNRKSASLKEFIINVTCNEFELNPYFIRNKKIRRKSPRQRICFSIIVFFLKKYVSLSFKEILHSLGVKHVNESVICANHSELVRMTDKTDKGKKYLPVIMKLDHEIKNYIDQNTNIQ